MATNFPTYLPLAEAAERYSIPQKTLHTALEQGALRGAQLPDGQLLVAIEDVQVLAEQLEPLAVDPDLVGQPIRVTEAAEKYTLNQRSLCNWAYAGYVRILEKGPKVLVLDESEVQRAANLFHRARQATGSYVRAGWVLKRTLNQFKNCS